MKELQTQIKAWPFKLESGFTTAWLKTLRDKGFYVDKISDGSIGTKKVDCYIATNKAFYICEIKIIDKDIFPLSRLRPNQLKGLRLANDLWKKNWIKDVSIVVVYSKTLNKYKIIPFDVIKNVDVNDSIKLNFD